MKQILQISKRVFVFMVVNLLIILTLSLIFNLLGLGRYTKGYDPKFLLAFCFIWGMGGAFISLALSRVIAKWSMGVQVIPPDVSDPELRDLVQTVHAFAQRAGLPKMPEVGVFESPDLNAFATGPTKSRALVAVSSGLLRGMRRDEVQGVVAHEVAHIANGDMVTMTLVQGVVNAFVMFLSRILAFAVSQALRGNSRDRDDRGGGFMYYMLQFLFEIVLGLFGMMVVAWFSRRREFRADAGGMLMAGKDKMIGALRALQRHYEVSHGQEASPSIQTMQISGKSGGLMALFASHPPLEERIAFLEGLGNR